MDSIEGLAVPVSRAELLVEPFGYWPSFHDAEVHRVELDRGDGARAPNAIADNHVFETDGTVDERGYFRNKTSVRVRLRFAAVDDLELYGLGCQNVISELVLAPTLEGRIRVSLAPCFGLSGTLTCASIEVLDVRSWPAPLPPQR